MPLETTTITQTVHIAAKPVQVYDALVNPRKHAEFTGATATGEARVGGAYTAWDGYIEGCHLELERGRRIVDRWSTSEWPPEYPPSRLEFRFEPSQGGTEVTMTHSEVPVSQADDYRQGWVDYYWTPLQEYFARAE